jgi:hypothetical protein
MTITTQQGSKPPFMYRYKPSGSPDAAYTPQGFQSSNTFANVPNGVYTVQVEDQCGGVTTQNVTVFNGSQQFVGIVGEIQPGVVCATRQVVLSVLSIGPVQWYEWYYTTDTTGGGSWTRIGNLVYPGSPTYVIDSATSADIGFYKVRIHNGNCQLESGVHIIDVLPPAGTPTISGATSFCQNSSSTLTATTSIPSPHYQWYRDSVAISGANSSTYNANVSGRYTVVVTPLNGCPSDHSNGLTVMLVSATAPASGDLSTDTACSAQYPVIRITNTTLGLVYNVYNASTGGTVVGSETGNGDTIYIALTVKPNTTTTYYVGTAAGSCMSPSRTAITVPVLISPSVFPITAPQSTICVQESITLSSITAGGVWSLSNANADILGSPSAMPVTILGQSSGRVYVTYTVGTGRCQSNTTFELNIGSTLTPSINIRVRR